MIVSGALTSPSTIGVAGFRLSVTAPAPAAPSPRAARGRRARFGAGYAPFDVGDGVLGVLEPRGSVCSSAASLSPMCRNIRRPGRRHQSVQLVRNIQSPNESHRDQHYGAALTTTDEAIDRVTTGLNTTLR